MNPCKHAHCGAKVRWPHLKEDLRKCVVARRESSQYISLAAIQFKARSMAFRDDIKYFLWINKFMPSYSCENLCWPTFH